jgi:hypothetical protein
MRKSYSFILPNPTRATSKHRTTLTNKENDKRLSNNIKSLEATLLKKSYIEDNLSTKTRSFSSKPTSKCSTTTTADTIRSVSPKKKHAIEKVRTKRYFTSFKKRKYSELKSFNSTSKKRAVLASNKKVFRDIIRFDDPFDKKTHSFPLYSEKDVLNIYFKTSLTHQDLDNDVETDEDQLNDAKRFLMNSLSDGINQFRKCK